MRRQVMKPNASIYFNDIVNGNTRYDLLTESLSDDYCLTIVDDRTVTNRGDFERAFKVLNEQFSTRRDCAFKWLKKSSFNRLCKHILDGEIDRVSVLNPIDEYGRLATNLSDNGIVPVRFYISEKRDLWRVPIERLDIIDDKFDVFNRDIMGDDDVLRGVDYICQQIESYAQNDLEKVVLLDKLIRENVQFDNFVYSSEYNSWDQVEKFYYKGRTIQALLATKSSVCAGISLLSAMILNKLNVPARTILGHCHEGHAWNEVILDDKIYSCDFTHSLCFDKANGTRYLLVQKPSEYHSSYDTDFSNLYTYNRNEIVKAQKRLKDVHIKWPSYTSRRSAEVVENSEKVVKVKRRTARTIEDNSNK